MWLPSWRRLHLRLRLHEGKCWWWLVLLLLMTIEYQGWIGGETRDRGWPIQTVADVTTTIAQGTFNIVTTTIITTTNSTTASSKVLGVSLGSGGRFRLDLLSDVIVVVTVAVVVVVVVVVVVIIIGVSAIIRVDMVAVCVLGTGT